MRFFIIAGEASSDLHGANLVLAIKSMNKNAEFTGLGGPRMEQAGVELMEDMTRHSLMGFVEVARKLPYIRDLARRTFKYLEDNKPDAVILIDYPGFNLKAARKAKDLGIKVIYYISPQIWAWAGWRIKTIKSLVDHMLVVFPFEEELYKQAGVPVTFVGHPLLDELELDKFVPRDQLVEHFGLEGRRPLIGFLPGSRPQEIKRMLLPMIKCGEILEKKYDKAKFILLQAPTLATEVIMEQMKKSDLDICVAREYHQSLRMIFDVSFVASGTATVEGAMIGRPMVVLYKTSLLTYLTAKSLIQLDKIAMVNILAGHKIVPELIQGQANPENLARAAMDIIENPEISREQIEKLALVKESLGNSGASSKAASKILEVLAD
jgi:lipid-A-disaccharide synthase